MTGSIVGTGSYIPPFVMDNDAIAELVDTSDAWIRERTGVERRHIAKEETSVFMAAEAGRRALADAGMKAEEVDLIVVSTISSNVILPCTACEVQRELGAKNALCFDLNAACSGFVVAYHTAMAYLSSGVCRTALVIGSECLSRLLDWTDRSTCILFGDGAGAAVLQAGEGRTYLPAAHSAGEKGDALTCENARDTFLKMDGQAVFKFAVREVPEVIREVLTKNQIKPEEVDYYILHQANRRIVEAAAKRLGEPLEKFPMNLQEYGNTSSASIPILLDELKRAGRIKKGQRLVMAGFGAGLTWGAGILDWK